MPHAAIIVTGAVIVGAAAYVVYKEFIEPGIERRREEREQAWNDDELQRAMELSLLEQQHDERRRADRERWEHTHSTSTSSSARYDSLSNSNADGTMRRRRHADPFSDEHEMQEVSSLSKSNRSILFDAGPSSRLDALAFDATLQAAPAGRLSPLPYKADNYDEDDELLEIAKELSLQDQYITSEDLLHSPHSSIAGSGTLDDAYSVIEPDSRPGSTSPLVVDVSSLSSSSAALNTSFYTPVAASPPHLTAASLQQIEAEHYTSNNDIRASSPTPTIRSLTGTLDGISPALEQASAISPSYIDNASIQAPPSQTSSSRPISPFSELGVASAHSSDNDIDYTSPRLNSTAVGTNGKSAGVESDIESQWSDLGDDSSSDGDIAADERARGLDEREEQDLRERRQRFFASRASMTN